MTGVPKEGGKQLMLPLGARYVDAIAQHASFDAVQDLLAIDDGERIFEAVQTVMDGSSLPNFLHSAMCAMSLPVRRPKDETAPILRRDGNYSLIIQPMERFEPTGPNGEFVKVNKGVPFGRHARLILLFIMTEAVTQRSREIYLGSSFSSWLRRMKIGNVSSGGPRGTRSSVQEQLDRLMNCQWTMRWDSVAGKGRAGGEPKEISAFAVNDMKLANAYGGLRTDEGSFVSHFILSEAFYENLLLHSVPFNDRAIVALQKSATQLDLYTWLAYRLPRIPEGKELRLSWADLAKHLGNDTKEVFKFRQTVRQAWEVVSGVYQQARHCVDLGDLVIRMTKAPAPTEGHIFFEGTGRGPRRLITTKIRKPDARALEAGQGAVLLSGTADVAGEVIALPLPAIRFPEGDELQFAAPELYQIGVRYGSGNAVSLMAAAFRKRLGSELGGLSGDRLKQRWQAYCSSWKAPA